MRTFTVTAASVLLALVAVASVGAASAQTAPSQPTVAPAPRGAGARPSGQTTLDDSVNAANLWVNQVIGKFLEGPAEDRSAPARPNR